MKMKAHAEATQTANNNKTPEQLVRENNIAKVSGACKRYGVNEVPAQLTELLNKVDEKAGKAIATLAEAFESTLKGGDELRDGEYAVRLSTIEDKTKGGRILVFTAPELLEGIKAEHAKVQAKNDAAKAAQQLEKAQKRAAAEVAERERIAKRRADELLDHGIPSDEGLRNFLMELPTRAKVRYDGARLRVQKIASENEADRVRIFGDPEGEYFAVSVDNGGWLALTIFVDGIDYVSETVERLSMSPEKAAEIQKEKDLPKAPVAFDREIPADILRSIAEELPHDRRYIPYPHVYTWRESFEFARKAVSVPKAKRGESVLLLLQGESPVEFVKIDNYYENGEAASGIVPVEFDDEQWAAFLNPRNGSITVYDPTDDD